VTNRQLPGILAGLGAASIWGVMYVVSKVILDVIPPSALITLRLLLAMAALSIIVLARGRPLPRRNQILRAAGIGVIGYGISLGFQFAGTKFSTAGNGAVVTSATPAFVMVFAAVILGERINARSLVALGLSSLGVLLVIDPSSASLEPQLFLGNVLLLFAAITWALYSVLIGRAVRESDLYQMTLAAFAGGLVVSVPLGLWEVRNAGIGGVTPAIVGGVLFLGLVATALAMVLWNGAFGVLPSALASLTFFAQPVVGALLGAWLLGEKITPAFLLGGALIGAGLLVASGLSARRSPTPES
jgi:drug/metabolite transporter (DMT)-like permease